VSDLVIIGAGITGLSAGLRAGQKGMDSVVYEQDDHIGGLSATQSVNGFSFDFSGHLLHPKDPSFLAYLHGLLGGNLRCLSRKSSVFSHDVFLPFPFQANLRNLPPKAKQECLQGFVKAYYENEDLPTEHYETFQDWIVAKLGTGIGRHFMVPYNSKVWTVPPKKMTCEWLSEYVPRPSLKEVFDGAFSEQKKSFGYNAEFLYPRRGGIQALANALADQIPRIRLNERLVRLHLNEHCAEFESGRLVQYDALISTVPLKRLAGMIGRQAPAEVIQAGKSLRHNSLLILNLGVKGQGLTDKHWIYVPERKFRPYRVGVYTNFSRSMAPPGMTSFYVEMAYQKSWNIDRKKAQDKAIADLLKIGFLRRAEDVITAFMMDVECAYVIYDRNWAKSRKLILDFLETKDVHSLGRYGRWEYSDMEAAFQQGRSGVDRLAK
jgi:protoporphyrinogen oxidase